MIQVVVKNIGKIRKESANMISFELKDDSIGEIGSKFSYMGYNWELVDIIDRRAYLTSNNSIFTWQAWMEVPIGTEARDIVSMFRIDDF